VTSEALNQAIELIKQWSEQASLSTDHFDSQALRSAMTTTQIPAEKIKQLYDVRLERCPVYLVQIKSLQVGTTLETNPS